MKKNREISQENFETLLDWLSEDREKAGEKYEEIRESLVRLFELKGCHDSQTLADETINRLTSKIHTLKLQAGVKPITLFFGFAKNIYFEASRQKESQLDPVSPGFFDKKIEDEPNLYLDYLRECLKNHSTEEREFILEYYAKDKLEKIVQRRQLAKKMEIAQGTMNVRMHRIRLALQKCIESKIN
jgi:DNA-directed RNA polymerase specialized sigma24 family protein